VNQYVQGTIDYIPKRVVERELLSLPIYNGLSFEMWYCSD